MPLSFSWTTRVDGVNYPVVADINLTAEAVVSIIAALGGTPQGTATDLETRLSKALSGTGYLDLATSTELTIATGSVTPTQNWHTIDTQSDAATDDLDTIVASGVTDGFILLFRASHTSRDVVVKHNTGNIVTTTGLDLTLDETYKLCFAVYDASLTKWIVGMIGGGAAATPAKGRVEILSSSVPLTLGAPLGFIDSASSPVESFPYFEFGDSALAYVDLYCRLVDYQGGGLTVKFELLRTSAAAAAGYYFQAAIRRINTGTEDITASHTYDYNSVTVTVPAGPPAAGIPMSGTITFTDGADMDSLADNEMFILRIRRDPTNAADNAGDAARVLSTISIKET